MRFLAATALVMSLLSARVAAAAQHPVPKDRASLATSECLPYVISKVAPLEWWSIAASTADLRRGDYVRDQRYELEKQNTWEFPRFCFSMFRPTPEAEAALLAAVDQYNGNVVWEMHDNCIGAEPAKRTFYPVTTEITPEQVSAMLEEAARNPPKADPEVVKRALADLPHFCAYLESRLNLADKLPIDFDPQWLTRQGLESSRGPFENFVESGSWGVLLTKYPEEAARNVEPPPFGDKQWLNFGIDLYEWDELFEELGADWKKYQAAGQTGSLLPEYPLLSRLSDETADAVYQPSEISAFLAECLRAQSLVKDPLSIRGLDKLIRTARWAQKLDAGIYFAGQ